MGRLLLIRHAQSTWNAAGKWQGWADPPLSREGEADAAAAAARLAGNGLTRAVSSDLVRAKQTAGILARALGLGEVSVDPGLRERNVGEWSGLTRTVIEERWPGQLAAWRAGELERPPGGETQAELDSRVMDALARVADGGGVPLVVTHGGVIHSVERQLGAEVSSIGNLAGRWLEDELVIGEALVTDRGTTTEGATVL